MARPKSEDKRKAILIAAGEVIAEQGLSAPTAKIARRAGVAEGTLFTYFASKDELMNQLYLDLKQDLHAALLTTHPRNESLRNRSRHLWQAYIGWGLADPWKRKVMAQLALYDGITAQSREAGARPFAEITAVLQASIELGQLRVPSVAFCGAILTALVETTIDFMTQHPHDAQLYADAGFSAFWKAVTGE